MPAIAAILAALTVADKFLTHPLIKRLVLHLSASTSTKIDDFLCSMIYGAAEEKIPEVLAEVQAHVDAMAPEAKAEAKVAVPLPVDVAAAINGERIMELMAAG
jgi:hypothetical protein